MTLLVIYSMSVSLDGFIAGPDGSIDWAAPGEELMAFHNEQTRELAGHLSGRGLYEDMLPWESRDDAGQDPRAREFAQLWKAVPKVVFSTTLSAVEGNARLATAPVADEIVRLREGSDGFLSVGGAGLASTLVEQDIIDEYRLFVNPVVLGGGTPYFPEGRDRLDLELAETHTFDSRVVYLRYRRTRSESAGERNGSR